MKWTGMAALAVFALAGICQANDPVPAGVRMPNPRGPLNTAANWWARYGEPVNQEAIEAAPAKAIPIAPAGWTDRGYGYVFGIGSCDYTPACTDWQWADYHPMPWRCQPYSGWHWGRRCGHCGHGGHCGCGQAAGCGCAKAVDHGCAAPAPVCDVKAPTCEAVPSCGCDVATSCCGKRHFHWHWKGLGFWNKHCGCDTCAPSCGYDVPGKDLGPGQAPFMEQAPPKPLPEAPSHAATHTKPTLVWPLGPVR